MRTAAQAAKGESMRTRSTLVLGPFALAAAALCACRMAPLQTVASPDQVVEAPVQMPRIPDPDPGAAWVPEGYRVEVAVKDLSYPTSVEFDGHAGLYVAESGYAYGDPAAPARVLHITPDGRAEIVAD